MAELMIKNQMLSLETIRTIGELRSALADFKDTDTVVIEVRDIVLHEDLYGFYVDEIDGMATVDGKDDGREIRLCPIPYK